MEGNRWEFSASFGSILFEYWQKPKENAQRPFLGFGIFVELIVV